MKVVELSTCDRCERIPLSNNNFFYVPSFFRKAKFVFELELQNSNKIIQVPQPGVQNDQQNISPN
jgi:hypothetical protein